MAFCLAERADEYVPSNVSETFRDSIKNWQKKTVQVFTQGIGSIPGAVGVHFSSTKRDKKSYEKWEILQDNLFDPRNDLTRGDGGVYAINHNKPKLLEDMRVFFNAINGEMQDL